MDAYSKSVAPIELFGRLGDAYESCGRATGFFYRREGDLYLITNWHVVTGVDPLTMIRLDACGILPDKLLVQYKQSTDRDGRPVPGNEAVAVANFPKEIDLYNRNNTLWFEHGTRQNVDVVAIKLVANELGELANVPVNEVDQTPDLVLAPGMDCFVLGYPNGMIGPGLTPIWKRGSIASEPTYPYRNRPGFLIDTATRDGMSGSPVIARHSGLYKPSPGPGLRGDEIIGTVTRFAGIYSGRIGEDEMGVQLGMVWRTDVLDDILSGRTGGVNPLR
jgi:hypothetical protein